MYEHMYFRVSALFRLHVGVSDYTWRPIIDHLLHHKTFPKSALVRTTNQRLAARILASLVLVATGRRRRLGGSDGVFRGHYDRLTTLFAKLKIKLRTVYIDKLQTNFVLQSN